MKGSPELIFNSKSLYFIMEEDDPNKQKQNAIPDTVSEVQASKVEKVKVEEAKV